jgi:hypothetical protein
MNKESTGKEGDSAGNYQLIPLRKGIPPVITSSFTWIQAGKIKFLKIFQTVTIPGSAAPNLTF